MKEATQDGAVEVTVRMAGGVVLSTYEKSGKPTGYHIPLTLENAAVTHKLLGIYIQNRIGECIDEIERTGPAPGATNGNASKENDK